jgi:hypothetical protein
LVNIPLISGKMKYNSKFQIQILMHGFMPYATLWSKPFIGKFYTTIKGIVH